MTASTTARKQAPGWITYLVLIVAWEGTARIYPSVVLPGPLETLHTLAKLFAEGRIWKPLELSFLRFAAGFGLSFLLGTLLGIGCGIYDRLYAFIRPVVGLLQAIPPVSWILLAILWFGVHGGAQVLVVTVALFPVFFFNSVQGIRQVSREMLEMAQVFRVPRSKQMRDIYFPALAPFWSAALTVNLGTGWKTVVMSELISGQTGIGAAMNTARIYLKTDEVMAWTLLVAVLGMGLEAAARGWLARKRARNVCDSNISP
ncbi:ABC transporter permease [Paenibacillus sp. y28]|uniref:ABC transporter permease n=1 Tax=Paenibacillus sp. y28 TaxID=3129110 RepID=UPI00301940A8